MIQNMFFQYTGIITWCIIGVMLVIGILYVVAIICTILWELFMEWNRKKPTFIYQVAEFLTLWLKYELRKGDLNLNNRQWLEFIIGPINKQNRFQWSRNYWVKIVKIARKQRFEVVNKNATRY